ncbi:30S ribosomal protein S31, mitochondrial [Fagus crenata]
MVVLGKDRPGPAHNANPTNSFSDESVDNGFECVKCEAERAKGMAMMQWCGAVARRVMMAHRPASSSLTSSSMGGGVVPIVCGRGDKKTKKGKRFKGSYGNARPKKEKKIERIKDRVELRNDMVELGSAIRSRIGLMLNNLERLGKESWLMMNTDMALKTAEWMNTISAVESS